MKKILSALLTAAILLTTTACGNSQIGGNSEASTSSTTAEQISPQNSTEPDSITVSLSSYDGIYTNSNNGETITIQNGNVIYNGATLAIESNADNYFILSGSSAIFIMGENYINTNLSHPDDDSYLDIYIKEIAQSSEENTTAILEESPVTESSTSEAPVSEEDGFDDVTPISLTIAGDEITLPVSAEALEVLGWQYSDVGGSGRYTKGECCFVAYNGIEYAQQGQLVTGFKVISSGLAGQDLTFNNGISFNSMLSDIRTKYGNETTFFENSYANTYEFTQERLTLQVEIANETAYGSEKGKIESILIQFESKYARDPNTGEYKYID